MNEDTSKKHKQKHHTHKNKKSLKNKKVKETYTHHLQKPRISSDLLLDSSDYPHDKVTDEIMQSDDDMKSDSLSDKSMSDEESQDLRSSIKAAEEEEVKIRKQLMEMPFEELQQLKEKIGLKAFKEAMYGTGSEQKRKRKGAFKRENKNRPMEMSSKVPVARQRKVNTEKKKLHRDPRFDDLSGEYNEHFFKEAYSFLDDMKQNEKLKLLKTFKKEKDENKKEELEYLIKRMNQQEQSERDKSDRQKRIRQRKQKEKELVAEGKRPFYLKKSDQKKLDLAEKYRELKKSGKLEKYLQRKRKKNASKERKKLPNRPN